MTDINILKEVGVNLEKSLELFGDIQTYNDALVTFADEALNKMENIEKYKEASDMANYAILVHSLKSDAKYFGFEKLAELALNHEMKSKENDMYYVAENFPELKEEALKMINLSKKYLGIEYSEEALVSNKITINDVVETILVVDDSDIISKFVQRIFKEKYNVILASNGEQAINILKIADFSKIKGILLDLNMPGVDGFQVLDYFKEKDIFKSIPVSIITGELAPENIKRAQTYPIIAILGKPFSEVTVKQLVEKTIGIK